MPTWIELVQLTDSDLARLDIATVHLCCAQGLPGTEGLDTGQCAKQLDSFARRIEQTTERLLPKFHRDRETFKGSEASFRMLCLVTVLQRDLGVYADRKLNSKLD